MRGSIRRRGNGSWQVRVYAGRDQNGDERYVHRTVHGTRRDAERMANELASEAGNGMLAPPSKMTVREHLESWLQDHVRLQLAASTYERYEEVAECWIVPGIGHLRLQRLEAAQVQGLYNRLLDGGLAPRTVHIVHAVLHRSLGHAVREGLVARNPSDGVDLPRIQQRDMRMLDEGQVGKLFEAASGTAVYPVLYVAVMTGMRLGEILGLRWQDVDLVTGQAAVRQSLKVLRRQGVVLQPTKTHRSRRSVDLGDTVVRLLDELLARQKVERELMGRAYKDRDLVFAKGDGDPLHPNNVRRWFKEALKRAGLPDMRFHDLRHAHATLMLRRGVHPKIVSERLGHVSVAITLDIYSHVVPGIQREAAQELDAWIGRSDPWPNPWPTRHKLAFLQVWQADLVPKVGFEPTHT